MSDGAVSSPFVLGCAPVSAVAMPQVQGVSHRMVEARGIRFHVAEAGAGDGLPVLLVHGWPQHWGVWRKVLPLLEDERRLICQIGRAHV